MLVRRLRTHIRRFRTDIRKLLTEHTKMKNLQRGYKRQIIWQKSRKPFTLHFLSVSCLVSVFYIGEGLSQPFTTLHCPSPHWSPAFVGCRNWLSYDSLLLLLALNFYQKNGLEEWNRWRVVKGGEGLEQPFTLTTYWIPTTYVVKVKGEGFVEIFSWIYKIWDRNVAVLSHTQISNNLHKMIQTVKKLLKSLAVSFLFLTFAPTFASCPTRLGFSANRAWLRICLYCKVPRPFICRFTFIN